MKQYLNFTQTKITYSLKHSFGLVFHKIETIFFSFLCVVFILLSKFNHDFSPKISAVIVDVSMPIVNFAAFPFNATINGLTNFKELIEAKEENKSLKEELDKLRSYYIQSLNIHNENKELRQALNFVNLRVTKFQTARIIGRANQLFAQKVFIGGGLDLGIKEGNIVTNNHGAIGRIAEVFDDKSRLILFTDATSRVPIITSKARARGILVGNNSSVMEILYLSKNHKIEVGDWVFTSGDGDTLPPGILIGIVKKVNGNQVDVVMAEDIGAADIVTVLDY